MRIKVLYGELGHDLNEQHFPMSTLLESKVKASWSEQMKSQTSRNSPQSQN